MYAIRTQKVAFLEDIKQNEYMSSVAVRYSKTLIMYYIIVKAPVGIIILLPTCHTCFA